MDFRNNCTVHALANARGIPLEEAYLILKKAGRKDNQGFHMGYWLPHQSFATSIDLVPLSRGRGTRKYSLRGKDIVKMFPVGRYIIKTAHHVIALVDGKIIDNANYKRIAALSLFKIEPAKKAVVIPAVHVSFPSMIPSPWWS